MDADTLKPYLDDLPLGGWRFFESLGSTNDAALDWAKSEAPDMALVVSDFQLAGRGRFQRRWVTVAGAALAFSLVLHPTVEEMKSFYQFAGLGALAIVAALDRLGLTAQIKWPNDVLVERRKVSGILIENTWVGETLQALVIGIGINVSAHAVPPPDQVMFPATSLEVALGKPVDRWAVLRDVLSNLAINRKQLGTPEFIATWENHLAFKGEWVHISGGGEAERIGVVVGLSPNGSLRLSGEDGREFKVDAGDVHLRAVDNR